MTPAVGGTELGQAQGAHLWGQHFDELVQEAELGHLVVELLPTVVHTRLQHLHRHRTPMRRGSHRLQGSFQTWNHGSRRRTVKFGRKGETFRLSKKALACSCCN